MKINNEDLINSVTINSINDKQPILDCLRKNGVCLIPNYLSEEKCDLVKSECLKRSEVEHDMDFDDGSYRRFDVYKDSGAAANKRVYHTDCFSDDCMELKIDPRISNICKDYYNKGPYSVHVQVYERHQYHEIPVRSFHIDTFETSTFKAMLYLSDVRVEDGPNSYVISTHNDAELRRKKEFEWGPKKSENIEYLKPHPTNFLKEELGSMINNWVKFIGGKGSLILFDTWGVHCGLSPYKDGDRHVLVNYYRPGANLPRSDFGFDPNADYKKYFGKHEVKK